MKGKHITINYRTEAGKGNYGSDWKCLVDAGDWKLSDALEFAGRYSALNKAFLQVFTGKDIGRLYAEFNNGIRI